MFINGQYHTIIRRPDEVWVDGIPVDVDDPAGHDAGEQSFELFGSIQPLSPFRMQNAPEGLRTRRGIIFYAALEPRLQVASAGDPSPADLVVYEGRRYEVHAMEVWDAGTPIPHVVYECFASETGRRIR